MADLLQEALQHHQAGRLDLAEQAYQSILRANPAHPDALHLLGVVAYQRGNLARAEDLIRRAVAVNPGVAAFHCNLGEVCRAQGRLNQAEGHLRTAVALDARYAEAWNNLGVTLQATGRTDEATAAFRRAVELRDGYAMAHNNLGNALRQQGHMDEAAAEFRRAVQLEPALAVAHSNLGQTLLEMRQPDEALAHCRRAVQLAPASPEAQTNLGNVLREQGQLEQAKACYAEALRLRPNLAMTINNMGQAIQEEGDLGEAQRWYERAIQLEPSAARFHTNLASVFEEREQHAQALERYQLAVNLDPSYAEAKNGLGHALQELGRCDEAMRCYDEALRLKPGLAAAYVNKGHLLLELGDLKAAEASFRDALKIDPRLPGAHAQLAEILGKDLPEPDAAAMQELLKNPRVADHHREPIHFGLAGFLDAQGDYSAAAEHARQANALEKIRRQKRGEGYDPAAHSRFVDRLIATCSPDFFRSVRGGLDTGVPVFIVGMPRSGTTLFEQIIASHPQAFGAGELPYLRETFDGLPAALKLDKQPADCLPLLTPDTARSLADRHLERLRQLNADKARIVDKMPDNYLYLGLIAAFFPKATIIHCRRDPRDVAVSCWITSFRTIRWACDQDWIAARIRDYQRLMQHWRTVLPVPFIEMDYEDVVADLEPSARRLVECCGLNWDPACLAFHRTKRRIRTASLVQVRQPIYATSVARWKHYEKDLEGLFAACSGTSV